MSRRESNGKGARPAGLSRRRFMAYFSGVGLSATLLPGALAAFAIESDEITVEMIERAEKIAGLSFTIKEREEMVRDLAGLRRQYERVRGLRLENDVPPALYFNPVPPGKKIPAERKPFKMSVVETPAIRAEDLPFYTVTRLARLLETRRISSTELTGIYLERLKKYDPVLHCVVTLTEDLALEQARRADKEIAAGRYRGPLHGIPWGVKDLFAVKGHPTTWGAAPFKDQVIDMDAAVVKRLEEAGAVLAAKLSLGALAQGDVWFGGKTRNPWKPDQGAGGSSAGPAAATAAGLVGFAIGTETRGSIISPSNRCGVTGLRPTFGRVSRHGAMALCWSMDKIGPICRSAEDCAVVFNAIYGPDNKDFSVIDAPFNWDPDLDLASLRVGYSRAFHDKSPRNERERIAIQSYRDAVRALRSLGAGIRAVEIPKFDSSPLNFILSTEAAAAFDAFTRSNRDDLLKDSRWPRIFRLHRFVPAVEYIQANRARTLLMKEVDGLFDEMDVFVGGDLALTNLTGHPEVVIPNGLREDGTPYGISFTGGLFREAELLALAHQYQSATGRRPWGDVFRPRVFCTLSASNVPSGKVSD